MGGSGVWIVEALGNYGVTYLYDVSTSGNGDRNSVAPPDRCLICNRFRVSAFTLMLCKSQGLGSGEDRNLWSSSNLLECRLRSRGKLL
jgi:hypothetical protein